MSTPLRLFTDQNRFAWQTLLVVALSAAALARPSSAGQAVVDTKLWATDGSGPGGEAGVRVVARAGQVIYLGGDFRRVGPGTGGFVSLDAASGRPVPPFPKVLGTVRAVTSDGQGGWYIGGSFTYVGGLARSNLAHILADGSVASWDPKADGAASPPWRWAGIRSTPAGTLGTSAGSRGTTSPRSMRRRGQLRTGNRTRTPGS